MENRINAKIKGPWSLAKSSCITRFVLQEPRDCHRYDRRAIVPADVRADQTVSVVRAHLDHGVHDDNVRRGDRARVTVLVQVYAGNREPDAAGNRTVFRLEKIAARPPHRLRRHRTLIAVIVLCYWRVHWNILRTPHVRFPTDPY